LTDIRSLRRLFAGAPAVAACRRGSAVDAGRGAAIIEWVKVLLRNPRREVELRGPLSVLALLNRFSLNREAVLVVRNGTLVPGDAVLEDGDEVELRPVISGGALEPLRGAGRGPGGAARAIHAAGCGAGDGAAPATSVPNEAVAR
jgi:sulfur carrier protein